jgi:hypothetical protein
MLELLQAKCSMMVCRDVVFANDYLTYYLPNPPVIKCLRIDFVGSTILQKTPLSKSFKLPEVC